MELFFLFYLVIGALMATIEFRAASDSGDDQNWLWVTAVIFCWPGILAWLAFGGGE